MARYMLRKKILDDLKLSPGLSPCLVQCKPDKLKESPSSEAIYKDRKVPAFKEISIKTLAAHKLRNTDISDPIDKEYCLCNNSLGNK